MMTATSRAGWAAVLVVVLASCASPSLAPSSAGVPVPVVSDPTGEAWVAVLATAKAPSELSEQRAATLALLGDALGGYVVVSPVSCLHGLPGDLSVDGYVLAIQQGTRTEVRALAAQLPDAPDFVGQVHVVCTD